MRFFRDRSPITFTGIGFQTMAYSGNPGVKIRLTKKGINHLKTVGVKLLNEQIAGLKGHQTSFPLHQPAFEGFVQLNDFRVLQFHPAQVSVVNFLPPHEVVFGLENMDIWVASNFFATGGPIQVSGSADGSLIGMTVALTAQFASTIDGQMTVQVPNCSTIIGKSHFNINPQGPMGPLVKTLEGLINDGIRRKIPGLFCKKLKKLIEDNSPRLFARLTRTSFEEHFKSYNLTDNTVVKRFINDFVHGLYIDNRNIAHPSVTYDYFETQMRGEIRYAENDNPTPFYPRLAVHLHRSALPDMDPDSIEQLTPLAKTFIGPQLNDALKKGIPFPLTGSITFVDPALKQHEGFIELSTDFIINENALRAKIKQTFAGLEL
ncbi:hypothetical protein WR25_19710 [Diploscapter pachys]|uniref:Lipid-binding serum glycoprotein N-terminal domain-containing protein n=1 Tax=Diploscapter pachys TaxID=2018661 RepID=A0A2A2JVZ9_9BILA|nr:hypothetical protein WR25_19710 [Diploscapter pachys]